MRRHGVKAGHLVLQYVKALGAEVTAISTSTNRKEKAKRPGATHFVLRGVKDASKAAHSLDCLFFTSDAPYDKYSNLLDAFEKIILLALPDDVNIIGSIADQRATLEFSTKHNIRPMIEKLIMHKVNEDLQRVRDGKARYRIVLENKLQSCCIILIN
ncbi:hypothetical protein K493DRAFT_405115 [Basidiobolus meristosporus CBS 931.73]|uniref:NAD(P)-binding protein n=1 Tax=Basidiobolus meristosporus CBS 931.73 TaxID=1314790 RepID=A0A1Y1YYG6_9FUNG|nr:hypothetical protein K493DRAFT_405115 [Basidiobolus meristosporus CBS 931.73]|eukprot:ORY03009.1 hypothetical protein K493DRAFT_405115 [Basidiobolus meristosporus CBS 931.73]